MRRDREKDTVILSAEEADATGFPSEFPETEAPARCVLAALTLVRIDMMLDMDEIPGDLRAGLTQRAEVLAPFIEDLGVVAREVRVMEEVEKFRQEGL